LINRRTFLELAGLAVGHQAVAQKVKTGSRAVAGAGAEGDLTKYVDLHIGTGGHGHTYPGATMPFGAPIAPATQRFGLVCPQNTLPLNCAPGTFAPAVNP